MSLKTLILKKNEDRRLRSGHVWIYSNEVDVNKVPLSQFEMGDWVKIESSNGKPLGLGYINPHVLLCARLVSRDSEATVDKDFFIARLNRALAWRERYFAEPFYRWVYGESDGLPGLVVDRYGDVLVVQITTQGMAVYQSEILAALEAIAKPRGMVLHHDNPYRELEGLPLGEPEIIGDVPATVQLVEHGVKFDIPLLEGQKTGWFYDQRPNRGELEHYVKGKRVLDVFSYLGAWGLQAAYRGAEEVVCIDSSSKAIAGLMHNAELNGLTSKIQTRTADGFAELAALHAAGETFDVVILDPPALIKRRKDTKAGMSAYFHLNQLGMQLLGPDGLLISASCSLHLGLPDLADIMRRVGLQLEREQQFVAYGGQGVDHPIHPAIGETEYLKVIYSRVTSSKKETA